MTDGVSSSRLNDRAVALQVRLAQTSTVEYAPIVIGSMPPPHSNAYIHVAYAAPCGVRGATVYVRDGSIPAGSSLAKEKRPEPITPVSSL